MTNLKDNQNWLIKCLVITDQPVEKTKELVPVNDLTTVDSYHLLRRTFIFGYTWLILDLDNLKDFKDSEVIKTDLAFLAKRIIVISKDFNRLMFYKDFCDIYFGWENFLELNFFR